MAKILRSKGVTGRWGVVWPLEWQCGQPGVREVSQIGSGRSVHFRGYFQCSPSDGVTMPSDGKRNRQWQ